MYIVNVAIYSCILFDPILHLNYLKMEKSKLSIRECLLFEYKLQHSSAEATRNICQAKGEGAVSKSTAKRWFAHFRQQCFSLKDQQRSGRPTEINLGELQQAIESDSTLTQCQLASRLRCTQPNIHHHFRKLRLVSRAGQWTPHDLSPTQRQKRVDICRGLIEKHRRFDWLNNFVTGDEKWVLYVSIERKRQWLKPGQKPRPTPKHGLHPQKRMLSVWWDVQGILYFELLPERHTITGRTYTAQLQKLTNQIQRKRPGRHKIYFHHDNARPHIAKVVKKR